VKKDIQYHQYNSLNYIKINFRINILQPIKSNDIKEEINEIILRNITKEGNSNLFFNEKKGNLNLITAVE